MSARNGCAPLELLEQLNRWLGTSGYGADHPWRLSIAATLARYEHSVIVDNSSVEVVELLLCRARVSAEAGASYVRQLEGTQLCHGEIVQLFEAVAAVVRSVGQELRSALPSPAEN